MRKIIQKINQKQHFTANLDPRKKNGQVTKIFRFDEAGSLYQGQTPLPRQKNVSHLS